MALQRPVFQPFKRKINITHFFLGIDFGTSFTKVSYSYAPSNDVKIHTLKWDESTFEKGFVIPTVLYLKNQKLYFEKPDDNYLEVKYFKYSMLEESLQNNHQNTSNPFEELCCVYFLAQIITRSLTKIKEELRIENLNDIGITINMGAPLEEFYNEEEKQNKELYLQILENAVALAGGSKVHAELPENCVLLDNLDTVYTEILHKKPFLNWKADVVPELAAELFLYQQSKSIPEGMYIIVDIGGGTVDMALFEKSKMKKDAPFSMYCLNQRVLPYGVEILESNKDDVNENVFQQEFNSMVMERKNRINADVLDLQKIDVFFLGGGAKNQWYKNNIKESINWLKKAINPRFILDNEIIDFINEDETLIEKNQRLIISQMIAKDKDDIIRVLEYPNFDDALEKQEEELRKEEELDEPFEMYPDGSYYDD